MKQRTIKEKYKSYHPLLCAHKMAGYSSKLFLTLSLQLHKSAKHSIGMHAFWYVLHHPLVRAVRIEIDRKILISHVWGRLIRTQAP
jgi:hypothetical protein